MSRRTWQWMATTLSSACGALVAERLVALYSGPGVFGWEVVSVCAVVTLACQVMAIVVGGPR